MLGNLFSIWDHDLAFNPQPLLQEAWDSVLEDPEDSQVQVQPAVTLTGAVQLRQVLTDADGSL